MRLLFNIPKARRNRLLSACESLSIGNQELLSHDVALVAWWGDRFLIRVIGSDFLDCDAGQRDLVNLCHVMGINLGVTEILVWDAGSASFRASMAPLLSSSDCYNVRVSTTNDFQLFRAVAPRISRGRRVRAIRPKLPVQQKLARYSSGVLS